MCLQYLGAAATTRACGPARTILLKNLPRPEADTSYYWYHATQVMYHMQGKHWKAWNDKLRDLLVSTQDGRGTLAELEAGRPPRKAWRQALRHSPAALDA